MRKETHDSLHEPFFRLKAEKISEFSEVMNARGAVGVESRTE